MTNVAPVARNDAFTVNEDGVFSALAPGVLGNDSDVGGDVLTASLVPVSGPSNGALVLNANGSFTYTPNTNFNGTDSFRYKANDGLLDSNDATVTITVNAVNDAPVVTATQPAVTVDEGQTATNSGSVSDIDGDLVTLSASVGTVTNNGDGTWSWSFITSDGPTQSQTVAITANDGNGGTSQATFVLTVNPAADLVLTKLDTPDPVLVGGTLTYTLTVTNAGPSPATGVTLTDPLPAGVTLVSATPSQGACGAPAVTCTLGGLASGATATVTIVVTPTAAGPLTNTASVTAAELDLTPANNTAIATTTAAVAADVRIVRYNTRGPNLVGMCSRLNCDADKTHTIVVENLGPVPAIANISIAVDAVPSGPPANTCTVDGVGTGGSIPLATGVALAAGARVSQDIALRFLCAPASNQFIDQDYVLRAHIDNVSGIDVNPSNNDLTKKQTVR